MKFKINIPKKNINTIVQTIRFNGNSYNKIYDLSIKYNVSFNYIVNQMIKYAIDNMEENENE